MLLTLVFSITRARKHYSPAGSGFANRHGALESVSPAMNVRQLFDLTGRVAIITGGSIGLGRQMAEGLAEMGANVVLCARKKERCEQAATELQKLGIKTLAGMRCKTSSRRSGSRRHRFFSFRAPRYPDQQCRNLLGRSRGRNAPRALEQSHRDESDRHVSLFAGCRKANGLSAQRKNYQYRLRGGPARCSAGISGYRLPRQQGWRHFIHQRSGLQMGHSQHSGKLHCSRVVSHKYVASRDRTKQGRFPEQDSATAIRQRPRFERRGGFSCFQRLRLRYRSRLGCRWRANRLTGA
jgi:hypothetical protein